MSIAGIISELERLADAGDIPRERRRHLRRLADELSAQIGQLNPKPAEGTPFQRYIERHRGRSALAGPPKQLRLRDK